MELIMWLALMIIFVVIEVVTVQLVSIWLAAAAFITLIASALYDIPFYLQIGIFAVSSAFLLGITIPLIKSRSDKKHIATNYEIDIGKNAVVIEEINSDKCTGRAKLNNIDWTAISENGDVIPKDSVVTVTDIQGSKLIVKLKN